MRVKIPNQVKMFIRKKEFVQRVLLQSGESDVSEKSRIARLQFTRSTREASDPAGLESVPSRRVLSGSTRRKCRASSLRARGSTPVSAGRKSSSDSTFAALLPHSG